MGGKHAVKAWPNVLSSAMGIPIAHKCSRPIDQSMRSSRFRSADRHLAAFLHIRHKEGGKGKVFLAHNLLFKEYWGNLVHCPKLGSPGKASPKSYGQQVLSLPNQVLHEHVGQRNGH